MRFLGGREFWGQVRVQVTAGLILAAILGLLAWAAGWWPSIWRVISYPMPVPLFVVLAAVFALGFCAWRRWKARRGNGHFDAALESSGVTVTPQPSDDEHKVVAVLAAADGKHLGIDSIAKTTGFGSLRVQQALDMLAERDFVDASYGFGGTTYFLTSSGVRYASGRGYVRKDYSPR